MVGVYEDQVPQSKTIASSNFGLFNGKTPELTIYA
jgi:hypothetical protein